VPAKTAAAPSTRGESPVKVLSKAAALLSVLAARPDATPGELAEELAEPRSTLYRLLAALEEHGFVEPAPRKGAYQLGLRLFTLGSAVARRFADVRAAALPTLERLHEVTRQTIFLTVRRGLEAVCVERLDGELVQVMVLPVGGSIALHGGANARALLAFEPEPFWEEYAAHAPLQRFTDKTPVTADALFEELRRVHRDGFAVSDEDVIPGIASIGAPIFDHAGRLRASLSMSGPRPSVLAEHQTANIELIRHAGAEISRQLGQQPAHQ
jgi:DNA-binding IclR family transcriptional regulator